MGVKETEKAHRQIQGLHVYESASETCGQIWIYWAGDCGSPQTDRLADWAQACFSNQPSPGFTRTFPLFPVTLKWRFFPSGPFLWEYLSYFHTATDGLYSGVVTKQGLFKTAWSLWFESIFSVFAFGMEILPFSVSALIVLWNHRKTHACSSKSKVSNVSS